MHQRCLHSKITYQNIGAPGPGNVSAVEVEEVTSVGLGEVPCPECD